MNHNYPSLDSSGTKPQNAGYQYAEPPRSSNSAFEQNQAALMQPFIHNRLFPTSNVSSKAFNIHTAFVVIEIIAYYILLNHSYLFEYCFWSFSFEDFKESEFYPSKFPEEGTHSEFLSSLECDKSDFSRCPGMCAVFQRYSDSVIYFFIGSSIRYILHCIYAIWAVVESMTESFGDARKRFVYFNIAGFILLVGGILYVLINPGFQDFGKPLDSNEDDLNPESFKWNGGFFLMIFIAIWMPVSSLIAYYGFK